MRPNCPEKPMKNTRGTVSGSDEFFQFAHFFENGALKLTRSVFAASYKSSTKILR